MMEEQSLRQQKRGQVDVVFCQQILDISASFHRILEFLKEGSIACVLAFLWQFYG